MPAKKKPKVEWVCGECEEPLDPNKHKFCPNCGDKCEYEQDGKESIGPADNGQKRPKTAYTFRNIALAFLIIGILGILFGDHDNSSKTQEVPSSTTLTLIDPIQTLKEAIPNNQKNLAWYLDEWHSSLIDENTWKVWSGDERTLWKVSRDGGFCADNDLAEKYSGIQSCRIGFEGGITTTIHTTKKKSSSSSRTNAHNLAIINAGGYVSPDDSTVAQFQQLLDRLGRKTVNSEQQITDMSAKGRDMLAKKGVDISLMEFMRDMDYAIPPGERVDYAETAAAYILTRANMGY